MNYSIFLKLLKQIIKHSLQFVPPVSWNLQASFDWNLVLNFFTFGPKQRWTLASAETPTHHHAAFRLLRFHITTRRSEARRRRSTHINSLFKERKQPAPIIQQCHKHIHTYGRIASNGCSSSMFFSWTAAANGRLSVIGSAYGASGYHQRFRSATGSFPTIRAQSVPAEIGGSTAHRPRRRGWKTKPGDIPPHLGLRSRTLASKTFYAC